jgi:hypothetical protein
LAVRHDLNTLGLMVRRRAQRAVSNHGGSVRLAAILRDALASLGLLRMRSECWKVHRLFAGTTPRLPELPKESPGY